MTGPHLLEYVVRTGDVPAWYEETQFAGTGPRDPSLRAGH